MYTSYLRDQLPTPPFNTILRNGQLTRQGNMRGGHSRKENQLFTHRKAGEKRKMWWKGREGREIKGDRARPVSSERQKPIPSHAMLFMRIWRGQQVWHTDRWQWGAALRACPADWAPDRPTHIFKFPRCTRERAGRKNEMLTWDAFLLNAFLSFCTQCSRYNINWLIVPTTKVWFSDRPSPSPITS